MLGISSYGSGLVSHPAHWYTFWVHHPSSIEFIQSYSQSHYKLITTILELIPMSGNTSYTSIPMDDTNATDLYGSQTPGMLPVIICFVGSPAKFNGGRFITKIGLSRATEIWYTTYFTNDECDSKDNSVDALST